MTPAASSPPPRRIVVLGTGGTIAGRATQSSDNIGYKAGEVGVAQLLESAGTPQGGHGEMVLEQVAQVDSKDMGFALWQQLAQRCAHWLAQADVAGVVITHGTDTVEESAFFLQTVLAPGKPVVLTCAMRPSTALVPDGPQNLVDAMAVARTPGARGVMVVCAGKIHSPHDVQKVHSYLVDPFSSEPAGLLGVVEEGAVRRFRDWPAPASEPHPQTLLERVLSTPPAAWPRVELLSSYAGANGQMVQALMAQGVRGIVVAGTGNGTVHAELHEALIQAVAAGVAVQRSTRCLFGQVLATAADTLTDSQGLSPLKARIHLMLALLTQTP
nr:asparaginase [uncultured Rhodoferax sp.]